MAREDNDKAKKEKVKKEKVKVDYRGERYVTSFKKESYQDTTLSGLLLQIKFKEGYGGYKVTYEASKALKNRNR